MKVIRLQIPGNFLEHIGFAELFQELEFVEILNAFQYDQTHFFALQKIRFKHEIEGAIEKYIKSYFQPEAFQLLAQSGKEIICIMNQSNKSGFFPIFDSGPWALLFPIHISHQILLINIISQNEYIENLFNIISSFTKNFKIMGMTDVDKLDKFDNTLWKSAIPFPEFTKRQKDIATYAAKNGYFNSPKRISASKIADHFGITISAVNKFLRKAENKAMEFFFGRYI
ncbi:MAG: helix-turn-helix domain-containing protein [Promethearchaeota archaeon]